MNAPNKPVISRKVFLNAPTLIACWADDVKQFQDKHGANSFRSAEPLCSLPNELLKAIREMLPNLLTPQEVAFEHDLANLCMRHHAVGVFHGRPVNYALLNRPSIPILSESLFRLLGWDCYMTWQQAVRGFRECSGLLDPLCERSIAYAGWLLTNSRFLMERDHLRDRWGDAIEILGAIPAYPVRAAEDQGKACRPRNGTDVLAAFISDFNSFYERWQLQRMPTWDLPEPCGANLTGQQLPCNLPPSVSKFTIDVPTTLRLPAHFPLRSLIEEIQRQQTPEHLRPWLEVQDQQNRDGLRHSRFESMFQLAFFREAVLVRRYQDRFDGKKEKLDQAFADFLALGVDSIKKLRLTMVALRDHRG